MNLMANSGTDEMVVDLSDDDVKALEDAYGVIARREEAPVQKQAKVEATPAKVEAAPVKADENALMKRVREAEERAAAERAKRIEAEKLAHERGTTVAISQARAAESDFTAVANALTKATSDGEALKQAHQAALEAGDYAKATEAAAKMAKIEARIAQLEDGKAALEDKVRSARSQAETAIKTEGPKADTHADPFEAYVAKYPPREQAWFRAHPECISDPRMNAKAQSAHFAAIAAGITPSTDAYFDHIDGVLGFKEDGVVTDTGKTTDSDADDVVVETKAAPQKPAPRVAAPVSRDGAVVTKRADGKMQVWLTKAEAEMAEAMGMSATAYAKRKIEAEAKGLLGRNG